MNPGSDPMLGHLAQVVHETIIALIDTFNGTTPDIVAEEICERFPELQERFGDEGIERVADVMLRSELNIESGKFTAMYEELNREYFGGRLPDFDVRVVYDPGRPDYVDRLIIDRDHNTIRLRMSRWYDDFMLHGLVHAMAHLAIANDSDGPEWKEEMIRLRDAGAPVGEWDISDCSKFRIIEEAGRRIAIPDCSEDQVDHNEFS